MKTNFAVVAGPYCGVDSVVDLLAMHPNIRMHGQLFNRSDYALMNYLFEKNLLIKLGEDPIAFLESRILTDCDPDALAVGFALLYGHAKSESWNKIWRYVRKGFKIVHVKRKNLLDCFIDSMVGPAHVEPKELQNAFAAITSAWRENDIIFKHSDVINMESDIVLADSSSAFDDLCDFLDLPSFNKEEFSIVSPPHLEQSSKILNYDDLREHFSDKPEREFFR